MEVFLLKTLQIPKNPRKLRIKYKLVCADWTPFKLRETPDLDRFKQEIFITNTETNCDPIGLTFLGLLEYKPMESGLLWVAKQKPEQQSTREADLNVLGKRTSEDTEDTDSGTRESSYMHTISLGSYGEFRKYPRSPNLDEFLNKAIAESEDLTSFLAGREFEISYDEVIGLITLKIVCPNFSQSTHEVVFDCQGKVLQSRDPQQVIVNWVRELIESLKENQLDANKPLPDLHLTEFFRKLRLAANKFSFCIKHRLLKLPIANQENLIHQTVLSYVRWSQLFWQLIYKQILRLFQTGPLTSSSSPQSNRALSLTAEEKLELQQLIKSLQVFNNLKSIADSSQNTQNRHILLNAFTHSEYKVLLDFLEYRRFENGKLILRVFKDQELKTKFISLVEQQLQLEAILGKNLSNCSTSSQFKSLKPIAKLVQRLTLNAEDPHKDTLIHRKLSVVRCVLSNLSKSKRHSRLESIATLFSQQIFQVFTIGETTILITEHQPGGQPAPAVQYVVHVICHGNVLKTFPLPATHCTFLSRISTKMLDCPSSWGSFILSAGFSRNNYLMLALADFSKTCADPDVCPTFLESKTKSTEENRFWSVHNKVTFNSRRIVTVTETETEGGDYRLNCWQICERELTLRVQSQKFLSAIPATQQSDFRKPCNHLSFRASVEFKVDTASDLFAFCNYSTNRKESRWIRVALALFKFSVDSAQLELQCARTFHLDSLACGAIDCTSRMPLTLFRLQQLLYILVATTASARVLFVYHRAQLHAVRVNNQLLHSTPERITADGPLKLKGFKTHLPSWYFAKQTSDKLFNVFRLSYKL